MKIFGTSPVGGKVLLGLMLPWYTIFALVLHEKGRIDAYIVLSLPLLIAAIYRFRHLGVVSTLMTSPAKELDVGMLVRVLLSYAAWLTMLFAKIPFFVSVFITVAAPMFFGSVVWHLWMTRSSSTVNRFSFCAAVAFFPILALQIFAIMR